MVKIDITSTVKAAQTQNGLRHSDYLRYRRYCAKKLRRLRMKLNFKFGRGKYIKKDIPEDLYNDPKGLLLLLYNAERAWSHAMQLRQHLSLKASGFARHHLVKRLKKAVKWAEKLESAVTHVGDVKSTLQAQGYKAAMAGNLSLEMQNWQEAMTHLSTALAVYDKLASVADSIEEVGYRERMQSLEPMIRYCQHQLSADVSTQELLELKFSSSPEAALLNAQIETLLAETRQQKLQGAGDFEIGGKKYSIKNDKARLALQKAEEVFVAMQTAKDRLSLYTEAFSHYDEASRILKKERDEKMAAGDTVEANVWNSLYEAIHTLKKTRVFERNLELIRQAEAKFEDESDNVIKGIKPKGKPQDIVKIYDAALASLKQLEDPHKEAEIRGRRAYYMALVNVYNERFLEAYALLQRAIELGNTSDSVNKLSLKLQAALACRDNNLPDLSSLSLTATKEEFPPNLSLIPPKAVFFDLAWDALNYPDFAAKASSKGFLTKAWGRLFGR